MSTPGVHAAFAEEQVITFPADDFDSLSVDLNSQYPSGVIDLGTGGWFLSPPWQKLEGNSVAYHGDSGTFTFVGSHQLLKIDVYNGATTPATITLSCPGQPNQTDAVERRRVDGDRDWMEWYLPQCHGQLHDRL